VRGKVIGSGGDGVEGSARQAARRGGVCPGAGGSPRRVRPDDEPRCGLVEFAKGTAGRVGNRIFASNIGKWISATDFPVLPTVVEDREYGDPLVNSGRAGCGPVGGDSAYG
jgi:hypothetical protein